MAADLYRADAQPDITGSVLKQELESLHPPAGSEAVEMCVNCGLTSVVQTERRSQMRTRSTRFAVVCASGGTVVSSAQVAELAMRYANTPARAQIA